MVSWKWVWLWVGLFAAVSFWVVRKPHVEARAPARAPVAQVRADAKENDTATHAFAPRPFKPVVAAASAATAPYFLEHIGLLYEKQAVEPNPPETAPDASNIEIGDFTGDGKNDIVVLWHFLSSAHPVEVLVYQLVGETGYIGPTRYPYPDTFPFGAFTSMGDFNEDGTQDLVLSEDKLLAMYLSKPGGGFTITQRPIFEGRDTGSAVPPVVLDANRDGHLDLVFYMVKRSEADLKPWTPTTLTQLVTLLGNGRGEFPTRQWFVTFGSEPWHEETVQDMTIGDVDGDGWTDVAARVIQYGASEARVPLVRFYRNAGTRLAPWMNVNPTMAVGADYSSLEYIALGDVNRDGRVDLVGSAADAENVFPPPGNAWVIYQSPLGKFDTKPYKRKIAPLAQALEIADLDRDGNGDVVASGDGYPYLSYNLGVAGGVFGDGVLLGMRANDARTYLDGVAVGDLTGDGCPDVATAKSYYGVHIFAGRNCGKHVRPPKAMR